MSTKKFTASLQPFYTEVEINNATQYYIPTYCQNIAPSKEEEPGRTHAFATKELLIPFFTKKNYDEFSNRDKFYIILADSGMGKTTFMINLYLEYAKKFNNKPVNVRLFPLGYPNVLQEIEKIPENEQTDTIILLDAFDEDNEAIKDYKLRLQEILEQVSNFREIVLTCRTQFFPSEEEEPRETGVLAFNMGNKEQIFRKLYLSPFDEKDIKKYLGKRYPFFSFSKKRKAEEIVQQSPNLMVRPMLLSYVDDLIQREEKFEFTYQVYEELIARWIEREVARRPSGKDEYRENLYRLSRLVANDIYQNRRKRNGLIITAEEVKPLAQSHNIFLDDLELKSRSLLNRNARGQFKFSHKSILEYFIAIEAFENPQFQKKLDLEGMEQAGEFLDEMYFQKAKNLGGQFKFTKEADARSLNSIRPSELSKIKYVALRNITPEAIKTLRGFRGLERLQLDKIQIGIDRLQDLFYNNSLNLSRKFLIDINPIRFIDTLESIDLSFNQLTHVDALSTQKNIRAINLNTNKISDISGLSTVSSLQSLDVSDNRIADISTLENLFNIQSLDLSYNLISDISALSKLSKLKVLNLNNTQVSDLKPLWELKELKVLNVNRTNLTLNDVEHFKTFLPDCDVKF